jgi:hypothetical protein
MENRSAHDARVNRTTADDRHARVKPNDPAAAIRSPANQRDPRRTPTAQMIRDLRAAPAPSRGICPPCQSRLLLRRPRKAVVGDWP